ncbi:MAG TPA: hypothetical protein VK211_29045 [Kamptonema sp.]|nr:hypothetical protein [Kamptonema sp.]
MTTSSEKRQARRGRIFPDHSCEFTMAYNSAASGRIVSSRVNLWIEIS